MRDAGGGERHLNSIPAPRILHPASCILELSLSRVSRRHICRYRFARATEFGQRGFDLTMELVETSNQLVVSSVEPIDQFARRERRSGHEGLAPASSGVLRRGMGGGTACAALPEGTSTARCGAHQAAAGA
jgi:hypothetical protein